MTELLVNPYKFIFNSLVTSHGQNTHDMFSVDQIYPFQRLKNNKL